MKTIFHFLANKIHIPTFLKKMLVTVFFATIFSTSAFAVFSPTSPAFPHGSGITRQNGSCTEADPNCPTGLSFVSFNNFRDSITSIGVSDERNFAKIKNVTQNSGYSDVAGAKHGDILLIASYVHNNAHAGRADLTANNVTFKFDNMYSLGSGQYVSSPNTSLKFNNFISASNSNPGTVGDDIYVNSDNGKAIRLRYVPGNNQMTMTKGGQLTTLNGDAAFTSGASLGDVAGCAASSFYVYTYVYVEEYGYDLTINKTVDSVKTIAKTPGGTAKYKVDFTNVSGSKTEANNVKVVDDYDETKITVGTITPQSGIPLTCNNDGTKIVCQLGRVLLPNETLSFSYDAVIKTTATGTVDNTARVCAPYTNITDPNLWTIPDCIPYDTVKTNNTSSAQITLSVTAPTCGSNSKSFGPSETAYPSTAASYFCTTGTPTPTTPAFPEIGKTISWTCTNGGQTANCSATRTGGIVDVTIDKSINATQKNPGETVQYTLSFRNAQDTHGALPNGGANVPAEGVVIEDLFDSRYITITNANIVAPNGVTCSVTYESDPVLIALGYGGKIRCTIAGVLNPTTTNSTITYTGTIKDAAAFNTFPKTLPNYVAITATNETSARQNDNQDQASIVIVANTSNGNCGTNGTAGTPKEYGPSETAYPVNGTFCANGAAPVPNPPAFPGVGQTISWTCPGSNGGQPATCSAKRGTEQIVDVTIDKTATPTSRNPGENVAYTLAFRNAQDIHGVNGGATTAATGVKITDVFDARHLTILSTNIKAPAGFTCTVDITDPSLVAVGKGKIECIASGTLAPSTTNTLSITYTATVNTAGTFTSFPANIENNAIISATNETVNRQNDNIDNAIVIVTQPLSLIDLSIGKSVSSATAKAGDTLTYTLQYQNLSDITATNVVVKDFFDSTNLENVSVPSGCVIGLTAVPGNDAMDTSKWKTGIVCQRSSLTKAQGIQTITYTAKVKAGVATGTQINNTAHVMADQNETTMLNNQDSETVTIGSITTPTCTLTASPESIAIGGTSLLTWTTTNATSATLNASNVALNGSQTVTPTTTTTYTLLVTGTNGQTQTCQKTVTVGTPAFTITKEVSTDGTTFTETINRDNAQVAYYRIKVRNTTANVGSVTVKDALSAATNGGSLGAITNEVRGTLTGATITGTLAGNDLAITNFPINGEFIITYQRNASTTGIPANGSSEVIDTATLAGPSVPTPLTDTAKVVLSDKIIPTCTLAANPSVIGSAGAPVTLSWTTTNATSAVLNPTPGTVTSLPNGSTVVYPTTNSTYTLVVTSATGITNNCSAGVSLNTGGGGSSSSSSSSGGGGGCSTQGEIDLSIGKFIAYGTSWIASDKALEIPKNTTTTVRYKIVLSNSGSLSPSEVKVSDLFASSQGFTQSNIRDVSGAVYDTSTKTFTTPAVAVGKPLEFFYTADVKAGPSGSGKNTATIESIAYNSTCPILKDKKGVGRTSIGNVTVGGTPPPDGQVQNPNYILDKKVDKKFVKAGEIVNYTLSIKNTGNVDMENVILIDKFPSEFLSPSQELASRLTANNTLEFKRKFLPAGDTFSVNVKMKVRDGVPSGTEITNFLTADSDNVEINGTDKTTIIVQDPNVPQPPKVVRVAQTGIEIPAISILFMILGAVIFWRRKDIFQA